MTSSTDDIISKAMEQGKFENLPGKGKKLDLDDYFNTPEELRVGYSVLKSADYVPEEVEILQEIGELKAKLAQTSDEVIRKQLSREIQTKELKYNLLMERFKRNRPV